MFDKVNLLFKKNERILLFLSFIFLIFFTNISNYLFLDLGGIHLARQYDTFSFTEYYYTHNFNFFQSGNFNLGSSDGRCVGEFPIIYYLVSLLYLVFKNKILTFKVVNLLIFSVGYFYSHKIISKLLNQTNLLFSIFLNLLFYSSTVFLYYGSIFLPDIHSLTFCLSGIYYFFIYFEKNEKLGLSIILFTIAALLKASFFYYEISFVAYSFLFIKSITKNKVKLIAWSGFSCLVVFIWYYFAKKYNQDNNALYYTLSAKPIWTVSSEVISHALSMIFNYWYSKYYFQTTFHYITIVFIIGLIFYFFKKRISILIVFLIINSIFYVCLFLPKFIDHDYYFIVIIPTIIIVTTMVLNWIMSSLHDKKFLIVSLSFITCIISLLSINYAKLNLYRRYLNYSDNNLMLKYKIKGIEKYIESNKKVLIVGDESVNVGLGVINKFGYTVPNAKDYTENLEEITSKVDAIVIVDCHKNFINCKNYLLKFHELKIKNYNVKLFVK